MRLKITQIDIENFRSIQNKVTLKIIPGLFSIEGINFDENMSGNGSGKSSILSALYWCLTGNALTNEVLADEVVNIKSGKDCRVTVYIDSDQGEIKITRTRKDTEYGNNLLLEIAGQDLSCHKIADTQIRLNQIIKIPEDLLKSTIIMTSGMESAFSELSPQQRIQALESIRDYSIWDKVRETANKDIKDYNAEIQDRALKLSQYSGSINTYTTMLNTNNENLQQLYNTSNKEVLVKDKENYKNLIENIEKQISEKENELKTLKENENSTPIQESSTENSIDLNKIINEANSLKDSVRDLEFKKATIQKDIDTIDKWFKNDRCPTCGKPLDRTESEITEKNDLKTQYLIEITQITERIEALNKEILAKRDEYKLENDKLQKKAAEQAKIAEEIKQKNAKSLKCAADLQDLTNEKTKYEKEISRIDLKLNSFDEKEAEFKKNIIKFTEEINNLTKSISELDLEIKNFEKKRQLSDYFYKLLGSKGELRPYLLNKDIQYLNQCMQKYISVFFKNTSVELKLNGASIDICIDSNGIKKNVSSLSGGEKKRLNLAIQLGLYDLICSTAQVSFNTLWLDEVESEVDQQGIQQLIEIIEDISEKVETVLWITNNPNVKEAISDKIICKKKCGKTEVEVAY